MAFGTANRETIVNLSLIWACGLEKKKILENGGGSWDIHGVVFCEGKVEHIWIPRMLQVQVPG